MKARKSRATRCDARSMSLKNPGPSSRTAMGSSRMRGCSINWWAARRMATRRAVLLALPLSMHCSVNHHQFNSRERRTIVPMSWIGWALLSAAFAAATALLAKVGVAHVDSNLATALRTSVVVVFAWSIALILSKPGAGLLSEIRSLDRRTLLFLALSGLATGLSRSEEHTS